MTARTAAGLAAVFLVTLAGAPAAADDPTPTAGTTASANRPRNLGPATPGTTICTVSNNSLDEITGMVVKDGAILAVEGGTNGQPPQVEVWTIDMTSCQATRKGYGGSPLDPQDLALSADGNNLWIADIGNVGGDRKDKVALERIDLTKSSGVEYNRIAYPSTGQINGKALLFEADGTPLVIANAGGKGAVFKPDGPLVPNVQSGYPTLTKVGEFTPIKTETPSAKPGFAYSLVTGAAISPDRSRVVIRTLSDAYEFTIPAGATIAETITSPDAVPAITPLPDDDAEAIAYSADGTQFLTLGAGDKPALRSYTPFQVPAETSGNLPGGGGGGRGLSFADITNIAAGVGFLGLVAVVAGVIGIVRSRRQYAARLQNGDWDEDDYADEYDYEDEYVGAAPRRRPPGPGGRGAGPRGGRGGPGGRRPRPGAYDEEYGGPPYGGPPYGEEYGRPPYGGQGAGRYGEPVPPGRYGPAGPPMPGPVPQGPPMPGPVPQGPPMPGPVPQGPPPGPAGPARGGGRPQGGVYGSPRGGGTVYGGRGDHAGGYGQENIDH